MPHLCLLCLPTRTGFNNIGRCLNEISLVGFQQTCLAWWVFTLVSVRILIPLLTMMSPVVVRRAFVQWVVYYSLLWTLCSICSTFRVTLTMVISSGMSEPSSVLHSRQGTSQLKQTGMSTGKVDASFKAYAWSMLGYQDSFLCHWSWHHSTSFPVALSPGTQSSVKALILSSIILSLKWLISLVSSNL